MLALLPSQLQLYTEQQYYCYDDHSEWFISTGGRGTGGGEVSRGRVERGGRSDGLREERARVEGESEELVEMPAADVVLQKLSSIIVYLLIEAQPSLLWDT